MDAMDGHLGWYVVFIILLTIDFLQASFSAALQTISDNTLESFAEKDASRAAVIGQMQDAPAGLIRSCWLYLIVTAWPAAIICYEANGWHTYAAGCICSLLVYLFGRSIPRLVGKKHGIRLCASICRPIQLFMTIVSPLTLCLTVLTNGFVRLLGISPHELEDEVTEDEIISMVNEGHEQGVLDEHEAEMIQNIFQLDDTQAQDIMTHRKNICAIDASMNLKEAITFLVTAANSRFPVYEDNIDNIIGVLHLRDAVTAQNKGDYDTWLIRDIPDLIRPVSFIPETRNIDELFRTMQKAKMQMVIVVDEYGETAGLVTMEDILEEIVGNILDEYDEDTHFILENADGSYTMAGMAPLEEVEEVLGVSFHSEDYDTLNGYLVFLLDRIPNETDHPVIEDHGWRFTIEQVQSRMIEKVHVTRLTEADTVDTKSDTSGN